MTEPSFPVTRQQLEAVLTTREGNLADTPYPLLLLAMAVSGKTAVLMLRRNQLQKEIVFEGGAPVDCSSNIVTETLGRFLVASGKLSENDRHTAFSQSTARGVPLGEILVERKLLSPSELYRVLQQNLGRKLLEPFSWKSGTYQISLDVPSVDSPLRVKVPQLLVTGIMKVETQEAADEAAALAVGKYLSLGSEPFFSAHDFRPNADQRAVLDAAEKGKLFDKFRDASGIDVDDVNRIAYALMLLGIVTTSEWQVVARAPQPEEAKPSQPQPEVPFSAPFMSDAPPVVQAVEAASAEEVIAAYLGHKRKDAFDMLGISEEDGLLHAKQAFLRMADRFLPTKFDEDAPDGIREKAQDVLLAAARAYAELADDARRDALVKHRQRKREEAAAPKPESKKMIDPEELCRSGRDLAVSGKFREALSYFEMAAECDAQNGTYAAEAVWCRFQLGNTPASNADTMLRHALRRDPQSGVTHLYLGKVLAVQGKGVEAAAYLDRAARLMPGDDRPVEALKALQ